jgi:leucyl/phenylalanyl-tRNA---protein transferase
MILLNDNPIFPPVHFADPQGILAIGGDLSVNRLLEAYKNGIFPWFDPGTEPLWWAPPQRMVVFPEQYKPHKSVTALMRKGVFQITFNKQFEAVIRSCQQVKRQYEESTWISDDLVEAFLKLHQMGYAKSVEVWQNNELVGGLYGIDLGHVFCGESMFHTVSNASKVAFVWLIEKLKKENYQLLDCQVYNEHLAHLGAFEIDRADFMAILKGK